MELITKRIVLEPYKIRLSSYLPYYNFTEGGSLIVGTAQGENWNHFAPDIKISSLTGQYASLTDFCQTDINYENVEVIRYGTIMKLYNIIYNIAFKCQYYVKCNRNGSYVWVEYTDRRWRDEHGISDIYEDESIEIKSFVKLFETEEWEIINELPKIDASSPSNVCVTEYYDDYIKYFANFGNMSLFYSFFKDLHKESSILNGTNAEIPYANINIAIHETIDDIVSMSTTYEEWIPNKKYRQGEKVLHDGKIYTLSNADSFDLVEVSSDIALNADGDFVNTNYMSVTDGNGVLRYYYKSYYYSGYYNSSDKLTYFDSPTNNHWTLSDDNVDSEPNALYHVVSHAHSHLKSLMRKRSEVDDDNNELPFIIDPYNGNVGEMQFLLGKCNYNINNGIKYCDIMRSITFYDGMDISQTTTFEFNQASADNVLNGTRGIKGTLVPASGYVRFNYSKDVEIDDDNTLIDGTGVDYSEVYSYECLTLRCFVSGSEKSFYYISIDYGTTLDIDGDIEENDGLLSDIEYVVKRGSASNDDTANIFVKDPLIGIYNSKKSVDAFIKRGKSSAYERHNVLGEVNTMSDLENYRNNLFKI